MLQGEPRKTGVLRLLTHFTINLMLSCAHSSILMIALFPQIGIIRDGTLHSLLNAAFLYSALLKVSYEHLAL